MQIALPLKKHVTGKNYVITEYCLKTILLKVEILIPLLAGFLFNTPHARIKSCHN
jgi:hypothetical protein